MAQVFISPPDNAYASWRSRAGPVHSLREGEPAVPPERLLQAIWHHQRIRRASLKVEDGRRIRVLHPGFWNHESGPDFRGAVLQFENDAPVTGDLEVDLRSAGWKAHGHDRNPAFTRVILHVIWETDARPAGDLPTLVLSRILDAPLEELSSWFSSEIPEGWPVALRGQCSAPLRELAPAEVEALLEQAASIRLRQKAHELAARARQKGWTQSLWEGLFRALGYKQNLWPMQRIGELIPRLGESRGGVLAWQARLFGIAGLLPDEVDGRRPANQAYLVRLWEFWWRERERFISSILPRTLWRFNGIRPFNHPQRRLALAAHWLAANKFPAALEHWFESNPKNPALALLAILQAGPDPFWTRHYTLRSGRCPKEEALLGAARVTDLAMNVILPWFWSRAVAGRNETARRRAEERYFQWPPGQDNVVLRLAAQRLLGGSVRLPRKASAQQGLLQIVRDFCDHSNAVCEQCLFPAFVRQLKGKSET